MQGKTHRTAPTLFLRKGMEVPKLKPFYSYLVSDCNLIMKFHGKMRMISAPRLWGQSDRFFDYNNESSCHEFSVKSVKIEEKYMLYSSSVRPVSEVPSDVVFIAGKYPEDFLHGPASSLVSRSIMYPCNKFRCRIDCPCQLCRFKIHHCPDSISHLTTCTVCDFCRKDYNDHMLHHRAYHMQCKFCADLNRIFPQYTYTVLYKRNFEMDPEEERAFIFKHVHDDRFQQEGNIGPFHCDNCSTSFKRKADLRRHEVSHHFELKHVCRVCGKKFSRKDTFDSHQLVVHFKEGKTFKCEKCDDIFTKASNYQRHVKGSINTDGSSKYSCDVCQTTFCTSKKLSKHCQTHRTFKCEYCRKEFSTKQNLELHIANREEKQCSKCAKKFCNNLDLDIHVLSSSIHTRNENI